MNYFDLIKPNIDSFGFIAQSAGNNRDGGDTAQREGMFAFGSYLLNKIGKMSPNEFRAMSLRYEANLKILECKNCWNKKGNYRRHPDPNMWYSECNRMSRDQSTPNVVAMGALGLKKALKNFFLAHLKRGLLFTTNTVKNHVNKGDPGYKWKMPDFTGPEFWALYIRGFDLKILYPLLLIFDLETLIGSVSKVLRTKNKPKVSDDLNTIIVLLYSNDKMPTPWTWLAKKIYSKFRVKCDPPNGGYLSDFGPQTALDYYFAPERFGPNINEVYRELTPLLK